MPDKFCASCAAPLEPRQIYGAVRPACPQCGRIVFYDPKIAAVCVIPQHNNILMIRRATETGYGLWSLPGGYVDRGEVVEAAAAREAQEETGLQVAITQLIGLFSQPNHPVIVAAYTAQTTGGALIPGPEALDAAFFPPNALPPLAFPRDQEILTRWQTAR